MLSAAFRQVTIIGTGLIGGSLALALKKHGLAARVVGCDRADVLERAHTMGAIDSGSGDPGQAVGGSDVVVLATPVGAILDFLDRIAPRLPQEVLVTDVGSTKEDIVARAQSALGKDAGMRFLPAHPMAGKERSGIEQADADLFAGATWLFTPIMAQGGFAAELTCGREAIEGQGVEWIAAVEKIGAKAIIMDAGRHDRLCAWISHLPQMLSTALASTLVEQVADDADVSAIGGRALREMTRIAASPYSMWRDIAMTNTENIQEALLRLEQKLAHIRENLKTAELREEFEKGNTFHRNPGTRS
jgi:prephenate dehydrogenase